MIKTAIILALVAVLSGNALAAADTNDAIISTTKSLRGGDSSSSPANVVATAKPRDQRDLLFICNSIETQFGPEEVHCTCVYDWFGQEISVKCEFQKYRCVEEAAATRGQVCAIPTMEAKFTFSLTELNYEIFGKICNTNAWANNTLGGDFKLNSLCLDMTAQSGLTVPTGIKACGADFFGVNCDSCKRCTYDQPWTNRTGVSMKCNNLRVDPCFPLEIPLFVTNAKMKDLHPNAFIKSIMKNDLLFSQLLLGEAERVVNDAIALRRK